MIRVVIADDHAIVRTGLRSLLDDQPDLTVTAAIADEQRVVEAVGHGAGELGGGPAAA